MNIYASTTFRGYFPVGVAAVIFAKDKRQAVRLLKADLKARGLEQDISAKDLEVLSDSKAGVIMLNDGNY